MNKKKRTYEDRIIDFFFLVFFRVRHLSIIDRRILLLKLILDLFLMELIRSDRDLVRHKLNLLISRINHVLQSLHSFVFDKFHHEVHSKHFSSSSLKSSFFTYLKIKEFLQISRC